MWRIRSFDEFRHVTPTGHQIVTSTSFPFPCATWSVPYQHEPARFHWRSCSVSWQMASIDLAGRCHDAGDTSASERAWFPWRCHRARCLKLTQSTQNSFQQLYVQSSRIEMYTVYSEQPNCLAHQVIWEEINTENLLSMTPQSCAKVSLKPM